MEPIYIKMLGEFSIQAGENKITDSDNRSKKVWFLLAYLICRRNRVTPQKELIDLLWGDDSSSSNPENALKITFYRARTLLDQLWPSAGHQLIIRRDNGYTWNNDIPVTLDTDEFDRLCQPQSDNEEERLCSYLAALELYRGDFLPKLSAETWVIPITTHFHNLYIQTILNAVPLLSARNQHQKAADICRAALSVEPYHEPLHQQLMQSLAAMGDQKGVTAVYEELSQRLFADFGIKPGEETRAIYRAATQTLSDQSLPMDVVLEHLQESNAADGALQCEYDYFKILCHAEARAMIRSGKATHIALLSITGSSDKPLSKRSLDCAMENMREQIRLNLRRGDTFSRCSVSQYIVMLPQANYENSCMVCRRVIGAFTRKHPHTPAKVHFIVQPLGQSTLDS